MRCVIPQITWNSQQQMLSIDFDPTCKAEDGYYRLVTVGADTKILIWHLRDPNTLKPNLKFITELTHHQKAINVVRFSPNGQMIASGDDDSTIYIWVSNKVDSEEKWTMFKTLRKHLGDVTDLSWSPDSKYLISSSIDNTVVFWDVGKSSNNLKYVWNEHTGFVQGVSFDPLNQFAATISLDRTLRFYDSQTGQLKTKISRYPSGWTNSEEEASEVTLEVPPEPSPDDSEANNGDKAKKPLNPNKFLGSHMFQDDTLATFCRRLAFSLRGEFLLVPAGLMPAEKKALESTTKGSLDESLSSEPSKKKVKKESKALADDNAVILFCRNDFSIPCAVIPTGTSYSIACRFCPLYFHRGDNTFTYDENFTNPVKKDERRMFCVGKLDMKDERENNVLLDAPYRSVYAVATNNSVIIGSTDKTEPLAVVKNIHFARLTDLSWSSDGRVLVTSSTDGYVSIITFDENEFGIPVGLEVAATNPACLPVPVKETKVNIIKPKKKQKKIKTATTTATPDTLTSPKTPSAAPKTPAPIVNSTPPSTKKKQKRITPTLIDFVVKSPKLPTTTAITATSTTNINNSNSPSTEIKKQPKRIPLITLSTGVKPLPETSTAPTTTTVMTTTSETKSSSETQVITIDDDTN